MDNTKLDEMVSSLFSADTLIESEYFQTLHRTQHIEPEKTLMLGVLKDAIDSFLNNINARNGKRKRQFKEAEKWFFEAATPWTFSFESICGILGLDPGYIRKGLRQREREGSILMLSAGKPVPFSTRKTAARATSNLCSTGVEGDYQGHKRRRGRLRKTVGALY